MPGHESISPSERRECADRLALRPAEAARALGISERTLWSKTSAGEIPHLRVGRTVLYPVTDLKRWLTERAKGSTR